MAKTSLTINISDKHNAYKPDLKTDYLGSGSITPPAMFSRGFFDVTTISSSSSGSISLNSGTTTSSGSDLSGIIYREEYLIDKNGVVHFGINSGKIDTKPISGATEILVFGESIELTKSKGGSQSSGSSASTNTRNLKDPSVIHNPLEKSLLHKAASYLLSEDIITSVLVDIFARKNGMVQFTKEKNIEIHTVVLYKQPIVLGKHDILVIDPSNASFSSHFSNDDITKYLVGIPELGKITAPNNKFQIYKPVSNKQGLGSDQYRDCVDIAVKLALGLNKKTPKDYIKLDKIKEHEVVKAISNVQDTDEHFFAKNYAFRLKQTSNVEKVKLVNKLEKMIDIHTKGLSLISPVAYESVLKEREDLFKKLDKSYDNKKPDIKPLMEFDKGIIEGIEKELAASSSVLGDIAQEDASII